MQFWHVFLQCVALVTSVWSCLVMCAPWHNTAYLQSISSVKTMYGQLWPVKTSPGPGPCLKRQKTELDLQTLFWSCQRKFCQPISVTQTCLHNTATVLNSSYIIWLVFKLVESVDSKEKYSGSCFAPATGGNWWRSPQRITLIPPNPRESLLQLDSGFSTVPFVFLIPTHFMPLLWGPACRVDDWATTWWLMTGMVNNPANTLSPMKIGNDKWQTPMSPKQWWCSTWKPKQNINYGLFRSNTSQRKDARSSKLSVKSMEGVRDVQSDFVKVQSILWWFHSKKHIWNDFVEVQNDRRWIG